MRKKLTIYDIIFLSTAVILFFFAVFYPPVRSVADQGDFERVMRPMGLDFPDNYSFYEYAVRFYPTHFTREDLLLYIPRLLLIVPSNTFMLPSLAVRIICMGRFDMRVLAAIIFLWYTASCLYILRRVKIEHPVLRLIFIGLFLFVFFNGVNLTMFNSLYGQSTMLAAFAFLAAAALALFEDIQSVGKVKILIFTLAACLMLGAKLQCFVFTPFLMASVLYVGFKSNRRALCAVCAVFILWHGVGGYLINSHGTGKATLYNTVFYGILKDSPAPERDLEELGLDPAFAADAGKHAFMDKSEYAYPVTDDNFYSHVSNASIVRFYIMHPKRLISAMETTAASAFYNKIDLGTYEKTYGMEPYSSSYRLCMWENLRAKLPRTLAFIVPVWVFFLLLAVCRRKSQYFLPLIGVFIIGAIQFPMPYVGNGAADISKQLFMFNIIFDFGVVLTVYLAFKGLDKFFQKRS